MKEEILEKSLKLFLKYGTREMSNQKLVEWLGISTKTIYKYFTNKEGLLEEVLHLYHNQQYEMLESLPKEQNAACHFFEVWQIAIETEYKINLLFYQDLHHYYPELEKKVEGVIGQKFEQHFLSIIHRGIEQGAFRQDILPEVVLRSILALHRVAVRTEPFKHFHLSATDLLLNTTATFIRGLCTVDGMKALDEHIRTLRLSSGVVNASI
ncbi:TetR/AcrR family transcriptional regulator [Telluribacter sp.]|uniref:TetR/AcrR family transcriptional regulator n=1 Tax=Telluribacter sp. TaxID=1978767 RepID=UPI002E15ACFA|nr:TetR/AcrR family transcriptional regulator [Telluribacter sp.]